MKKRMAIHLAVMMILIMGAAFSLFGCKETKNTYAPPPPPAVTVTQPDFREITEYGRYTGTTEAVSFVEIRARVEGELIGIHFKDGARVRKGDLLFTIDSRPFQANLAKALADLRQQEATLKLAQTTLKRREGAFKDHAVSEVDLIEARSGKDSSTAAVNAAKSSLAIARLNLSYTKIYAPESGRISRRLVDTGNLVGAGERTLLASITRDDEMYVYFNISETELLEFRSAGAMTMDDHADTTDFMTSISLTLGRNRSYPIQGWLDYVDSRVDMISGTIQVRGVFPNPDHVLIPGLFVTLRLSKGEPAGQLLVPDQALGFDQRGSFLYVVGEKNLVEYRSVKTGDRHDHLRVIYSGIKPSDRVVINGLKRVRPGIEVTPGEAAAPSLTEKKEKKTEKEGKSNV